MITPLDIENKRFSKKRLNGYDPEEVDTFLDDLTKDYEELYKKNAEYKEQVDKLKDKLEKYTQIESTLQSTLLLAQTASEDAKNVAQKQAEQIIIDAESKVKEMTSGLDQQVINKKKEIEDCKKQFDVYKAKMEALLIAQLELLKDINNDDEM